MKEAQLSNLLLTLSDKSIVPLSTTPLCVLPATVQCHAYNKNTRQRTGAQVERVPLSVVRRIRGQIRPNGNDRAESANTGKNGRSNGPHRVGSCIIGSPCNKKRYRRATSHYYQETRAVSCMGILGTDCNCVPYNLKNDRCKYWRSSLSRAEAKESTRHGPYSPDEVRRHSPKLSFDRRWIKILSTSDITYNENSLKLPTA